VAKLIICEQKVAVHVAMHLINPHCRIVYLI